MIRTNLSKYIISDNVVFVNKKINSNAIELLFRMFSFSIIAYSSGGRTYNPIMKLHSHYLDLASCFIAKQDYPVAYYLSVLISYPINRILSIDFEIYFL